MRSRPTGGGTPVRVLGGSYALVGVYAAVLAGFLAAIVHHPIGHPVLQAGALGGIVYFSGKAAMVGWYLWRRPRGYLRACAKRLDVPSIEPTLRSVQGVRAAAIGLASAAIGFATVATLEFVAVVQPLVL